MGKKCVVGKKKEEQDQQNLMFVFSTLRKAVRICEVDFAIESQRGVVCKPFAFLCFGFHGATPIPYIQAAILTCPIPT